MSPRRFLDLSKMPPRPSAPLLEKLEAERRAESQRIFNALPVDMNTARSVLDIARAAGADLWFSTPTQIEIDIPKTVPEPLRGKLFLELYLNIKAIARLLEAESFQ